MEKRVLRRLKSLKGILDEKGSSLIEVMVSSVILTVGLLGLAAMFTFAAGGLNNTDNLTKATAIANNKIADFKMTALSEIATGSATVTENNITYTCDWTVTEPFGATLELKKVVITVTWQGKASWDKGQDGTYRTHRIRVATMTTGKPPTTN